MIMESIKDCYTYMLSADYKRRFLGEYLELGFRIHKLDRMLCKYKSGSLDFTPSCSIGLLEMQLSQMIGYKTILERRAKTEGIELPEVIYKGE